MQIKRPSDEQDRIDACILTLAETFGQKPTEAMLTGYQIGLADVPVDRIEAATAFALAKSTYMPRPAEIRELAGAKVPDAEDRAVMAWEVVCRSIGRVNSYDHVDFDDPCINAAIRSMGGWPELLERSGKDFDTWARKDFLTAYKSFVRSGVGEEAGAPLVGLGDTGTHQVLGSDGKKKTIILGGPKRIETGLPALPHIRREKIAATNVSGLVELKKA